MKIDPVLMASVALIVGAASFLVYTSLVQPLLGDGQYIEMKGRFNVVWIGNGPAPDTIKRYFLTDSAGNRTELEVTPYTRFLNGQSLSGFDGKITNVLGRFGSDGKFEAISIG